HRDRPRPRRVRRARGRADVARTLLVDLVLRRSPVPGLRRRRHRAGRLGRPLRQPLPRPRLRGRRGRFLRRARSPGWGWGGGVIRSALPKGRTFEPAAGALRAAGARLEGLDGESRRLVLPFPDDGIEILLLKDWDLPRYVEQGVADCGVVGSD